jgi:hemerythrin-like domain-containing protein
MMLMSLYCKELLLHGGSRLVQPIGPLMIEHRLIERMIAVMKTETERIKSEKNVDLRFIDSAVDFIKIYADRCHHGKEEKILFRELKKKELREEDKRVMEELIQEHIWGRQTTGKLLDARQQYANGNEAALITIIDLLKQLVDFYPKHIEKEDKNFFKAAMKYLNKKEQDAILREEHEFDRGFIHLVYQDIVHQAETSLTDK